MLEAHLEAYFRERVRKAGGLVVKMAPTQRGIPDRLVLLPGGMACLVELKTHTGRVSDIQRVWHERAAALGTPVSVLRGKGEINAWLADQLERAYERTHPQRKAARPAKMNTVPPRQP